MKTFRYKNKGEKKDTLIDSNIQCILKEREREREKEKEKEREAVWSECDPCPEGVEVRELSRQDQTRFVHLDTCQDFSFSLSIVRTGDARMRIGAKTRGSENNRRCTGDAPIMHRRRQVLVIRT
ncbi:hypothetical protein ElyMa_005481500 [Elysia marginata]|uniref:Uncharacterized protein n=1 Tax=Elysia marginata TaxID=1093978 RepID=A0AAV4ERJ7_9GAST|nr:hypothetical protein ElyMa_005481500 [Elysia marginata]